MHENVKHFFRNSVQIQNITEQECQINFHHNQKTYCLSEVKQLLLSKKSLLLYYSTLQCLVYTI